MQGLFKGITTLFDKMALVPVDQAVAQMGDIIAAQVRSCICVSLAS